MSERGDERCAAQSIPLMHRTRGNQSDGTQIDLKDAHHLQSFRVVGLHAEEPVLMRGFLRVLCDWATLGPGSIVFRVHLYSGERIEKDGSLIKDGEDDDLSFLRGNMQAFAHNA